MYVACISHYMKCRYYRVTENLKEKLLVFQWSRLNSISPDYFHIIPGYKCWCVNICLLICIIIVNSLMDVNSISPIVWFVCCMDGWMVGTRSLKITVYFLQICISSFNSNGIDCQVPVTSFDLNYHFRFAHDLRYIIVTIVHKNY